MNPLTLVDLLLSREFQAGLGWGAIGLVVLLATARAQPRPVWGLVVTGATLAASVTVVGMRLDLVVAVMIVAAGGELTRRNRLAGLLTAALGAVLVAFRSGIDDLWWIQLGTILFVVIGGWVISRVDDATGASGIPALMVAGTVFGVWATVPDTEIPSVLMGAITATLLVAWPLGRARIGFGGAYAIAAVVAWAVAIGGDVRAGSIIGGWATIGAFSLAIHNHADRIVPRKLLALHAGSVLVASRIAGLQDSPYVAVAIAVPALLATVLIGQFLVMKERRAETH